jgi:hypothetical protein
MAAPRLPEFRGGQVARGGRITSSALNSFARDPVERTISLAAKDALLRIVYGRTNIPGHLFAQGLIGSDLVSRGRWSPSPQRWLRRSRR